MKVGEIVSGTFYRGYTGFSEKCSVQDMLDYEAEIGNDTKDQAQTLDIDYSKYSFGQCGWYATKYGTAARYALFLEDIEEHKLENVKIIAVDDEDGYLLLFV